jgi:8-oxo-dGTP diphosphatase
VRVVAGLITRDREVLLDRRRRGSHLEGHWEFPGGKVEPGESDPDALIRELREELGVETEPLGPAVAQVVHPYDAFDVELILIPMRVTHGEPRAIEVDEIAWFDVDALDLTTMPPADGPLVEAARRWIAHRTQS